jgi:uncharacterized protein YbjT (DUF2867 family)
MILVTGGTGNIGGALAPMLVAAGEKVRALARDPKKASAALGPRVAVVAGDLARPDTFPAALAGVERAFFVTHAGPTAHDVGAAFFEAAKAAGVRHIVLVSSSTIEFEPPTAIGRWHGALEARLKESGVAWTMLRPGNFATNSLRWADSIRTQGSVYAPNGSGRSAPIDPRDIAAVAARALTSPGHEGKTYTLTGSELTTPRGQVESIGRALGKALHFVEVPEEGARAGMLKSGMPPMMVDAILELVRGPRGAELVTPTVREVTGKEARTFDEWVQENVSAFA